MLLCPGCNIPLCRIDYEGVTVHLCPDCRGALVRRPRLGTIERRRQRRWTRRQKRDIAAKALESDRLEPLPCPECLMPMKKQTVPMGDGAFHLDRCGPCRLYWFDPGELELAQILFERRADSRTPEDLDRIERAAVARMQLQEGKHHLARGADRPGARTRLWGWGGGRGGLRDSFFIAGSVAALLAAAVAAESHDLSGPSEFHRRQALKRIAFGAVVIGVLILVLYLLVR